MSNRPENAAESATSPKSVAADRPHRAAPRTLIALATYNEIENLPSLVDRLAEIAPRADVLVIDDHSPDGTGGWCDGRSQTDKQFHCLHRAGRLGLGTATIAAMRYAVREQYDYLVTLDADWSHPPSAIPELLAAVGGENFSADGDAEHGDSDSERCDGRNERIDVAIGSRYVPGGAIVGWPLRRRLMSRAVNRFARLALWLPAHDTSGAFRCYRVVRLARLDLSAVRSRGYSFFEEILWRLHRDGARFVEVPITFTERRHGQSKINTREAVLAIGVLARLGAKTWLGGH